MMSFLDRWVDSYDKLADIIGFLYVEQPEGGEVGDYAEGAVETRVVRRNPIHSLVARLTSLVSPAPVAQVRRRHAL